MKKPNRPRLSVDLDQKTHELLNQYLKPLRLKSAVFLTVSQNLANKLHKMSRADRSIFIARILDRKISLIEEDKDET